MKWRTEVAMYLLFSIAALPLAWAAIDLLVYYATYPESLQDRETHRDALLIMAVLPITMATLIPAAILALYFLAFGHTSTRVAVACITGMYVGVVTIRPGFPIHTITNLAWDASTTSLLVVLPLLFFSFRIWQRIKSPNPRFVRTPDTTRHVS